MENTTEQITSAISTVTTSLTGQINIATMGVIVAAVLGASIGLYVGWFAIRKVIRSVKDALHGKLKV